MNPHRPTFPHRKAAGPHPAHANERTSRPRPPDAAAPRPDFDEVRIHGLNACLAAFEARPEDLRKAWLSESRIPALKPVLAWCVKNRIGYRVVEDEAELAKLTGTERHEGVCFQMRRRVDPDLPTLLRNLGDGPACLLWLDGVGNPHNFGALLRSAAHFGVRGILLPSDSTLTLSGATCRVAEGGAEAVPVVRLGDTAEAINALQAAGFTLAATVPREADSLFEAKLPARTVFVLGAERDGMQHDLIERCALRLTIPGSGKVESLNIASAVAVLLAVWALRHPA